MPFIDTKYALGSDQYSLAVITLSGRCTGDMVETVESDCTRRFEMVAIPNSEGAILKPLDGTSGRIIEVTPSTLTNRKYLCVKVDGRTNPFAYEQTEGPYEGQTILWYVMRYQEVGGVS